MLVSPFGGPGPWATVKRVYVAEGGGGAGRKMGKLLLVGRKGRMVGWLVRVGGRVLKMASAVFGQIFSRILSVGPLTSQARAPTLLPWN